jgi:hypothetical protein
VAITRPGVGEEDSATTPPVSGETIDLHGAVHS